MQPQKGGARDRSQNGNLRDGASSASGMDEELYSKTRGTIGKGDITSSQMTGGGGERLIMTGPVTALDLATSATGGALPGTRAQLAVHPDILGCQRT